MMVGNRCAWLFLLFQTETYTDWKRLTMPPGCEEEEEEIRIVATPGGHSSVDQSASVLIC